MALPVELAPLVKAQATREGHKEVNDWIVGILAAAVGWKPDGPQQETLPLPKAS